MKKTISKADLRIYFDKYVDEKLKLMEATCVDKNSDLAVQIADRLSEVTAFVMFVDDEMKK